MKLETRLVGEAAVGKASLVWRLVADAFENRHIATLGVKVIRKELPARMPVSGERT